MKNIGKFWIILLMLLVVSCSNGKIKSWHEKEIISGKTVHNIPEFDIKFPETGFKVKKTESRNSNLGNILVTNWILQGKDKNGPFMYFVATNKIPQELKKEIKDAGPNSLNVAFQTMLISSATKLGGTDFQFKKIEYDNFEGMESICKVFRGDGIIKSRIYKIDNNFFMISAGGKEINIKTVDKFLNSFKIKK